MKLVVLDVAEEEIASIREGLDDSKARRRFDVALDSNLNYVLRFPEIAPQISGTFYHRRVLTGLPYLLTYRIDGDVIVLVAVTHGRQHQDTWKKNI